MVAILEKRSLRDFDWMLALLALMIVAFGTWQIHNAQPTETYWQKQLIGLGVAIVAMIAVAFTDYRKLVNFAPAFYIFGLLLLVIVLIPGVGMRINGQQCWIKLPVFGQFQPSEFVKIPTVLMLARYFGRPRHSALTLKETFIGVLILALPVGLILLEPDTGQTLTYLPLLGVVLFLSSVRAWIVVAALVLAIVAAPAAYFVGVKTGALSGYKLGVLAEPPEIPARAAHGLHLRRDGRDDRLPGLHPAAAGLRLTAVPADYGGAARPRPHRDARHHGNRRRPRLPALHQHRDGAGDAARHRLRHQRPVAPLRQLAVR